MATSPSEMFRASLKRCLANTEFPRQARVLADSLYIMAVASESQDDAIAWKELDRLADRHSHANLDIRPEFYEGWLQCLTAAARDHDPEFSPEIEEAWRKSLAPGLEHLRSRY